MTRGHAVAAVLAAAALAAPAPAFADIEQVRATASAVTVSGTTDAGGTLEAYALRPDRITVGVGDWSSRRAVTELEVGFRAIGSDTPWASHFQVDFAGSLR